MPTLPCLTLRVRASVAAALLLAAAAARPAAAQTPAPVPSAPMAPAIGPGDSASAADVERLLVVMDAERAHGQAMEMMLAAQQRNNPGLAQFSGVMRTFMAKHMNYAVLRPDIVRAYRETYSAADVRDLTEFYGTPLGRRLLARMPVAAARTNELMTARMQAKLPELMEAMQAGMRGPGQTP